MRLGILLPTFRSAPRDALAAADDAARRGLDGVFAYDHLWPMGSPERPALAPFEVLAAVAERQPALVVGPLVARVDEAALAALLGALARAGSTWAVFAPQVPIELLARLRR